MSINKATVVIPTLDNKESIKKVVQDVLAHSYKALVVDDGSNPPISTYLGEMKSDSLEILRHEHNLGKGAAIISGAKRVAELGDEFFIVMDGDGQHLASEVYKLIEARKNGDEIVIGARNFDIPNVPGGSKFGRKFSNFWAVLDTSQKITDSLSGFRLYPISILDLTIKSQKFDWEMEVLVKHAWKKRKIIETTIECYYPDPKERVSHFKKFWDTMSIVWVHVKLLPLRVLLLKGFI